MRIISKAMCICYIKCSFRKIETINWSSALICSSHEKEVHIMVTEGYLMHVAILFMNNLN